MTEEREKRPEKPREEPLDVGFREKDPRVVNHQYELDRLYHSWHSATDNEVALRKGRAIITLLMRWVEFGPEFDDEDRTAAKAAKAKLEGVVIKTAVKEQVVAGRKTYKVEWDSYAVHIGDADLEHALAFVRREAIDVKLDAQAECISHLLGICDRKEVLVRDYKVGKDEGDKLKDRVRR